MKVSQPIIRDLQVRAVRVPMADPHITAGGTVMESPLVLTDVITEDGIVGHSITFTYTSAALGPTAQLIRSLGPVLKGQPLAPSEIESQLSRRFRLLGTQGLIGMALAGIDMALWDALARHHQTSLAGLLGGVPKPIQAYGAVGYEGPTACAKAAEVWARRGFRGIKAKIGYPHVSKDIEVVLAIQQAVGKDIAIMVDYNQCLTPAEAIQRIHSLQDLGLTWIEEPTLAHDYEGHAHIAREVLPAIQCGENWWGTLDLRHAIATRASDFVMLDVMKIGGVTGWMHAAAMAKAHALPVSNHLWPEISTQLLSVTSTAHWLEYADWWNPIVAQPLQVKDGMAIPSDQPGSGVEWDEEAIRSCLV